MLDHHSPIALRIAKHDITAYRANGAANVLLIFVHGLTGHPISTWDGFGGELLTDPHFAKTDIVFYGYESLYESAVASAGFFAHFVDAAYGGTASMPQLKDTAKVFAGRTYDVVIFACHSLGAIIARRAVLDRVNAVAGKHIAPSWEGKSRTVLFAPAHAGGRPLAFARVALQSKNPLAALGHAMTMYNVPVLEDLDPEKDTVKDLAADIAKFSAEAGVPAHSIVIGMRDNVIVRPRIACDPPVKNVPDEDHITICKLRHDFDVPLTAIKGALP